MGDNREMLLIKKGQQKSETKREAEVSTTALFTSPNSNNSHHGPHCRDEKGYARFSSREFQCLHLLLYIGHRSFRSGQRLRRRSASLVTHLPRLPSNPTLAVNIASLVVQDRFKHDFGIYDQSTADFSHTKGWIVTIATAGAVFGCLVVRHHISLFRTITYTKIHCTWFNDRFGHRWALRGGTAIYMAGILGAGQLVRSEDCEASVTYLDCVSRVSPLVHALPFFFLTRDQAPRYETGGACLICRVRSHDRLPSAWSRGGGAFRKNEELDRKGGRDGGR